MTSFEKWVIQTYDGPLRQGTPVIPSGNSSKTKSNCILSCLLSFQCNLKFIMKRLKTKDMYLKKRNLCSHDPLALLYEIALGTVAVSELAAPLVALDENSHFQVTYLNI